MLRPVLFALTPILADGESALKAALIRLDGEHGDEYHLGFDNFYAITRYNHSALYAMAVTQLAAAIGERRVAEP